MYERINAGLAIAYEKLLQTKAALGQTVVAADSEGNCIELSAAELLANKHTKSKSAE